LITVAARNVVGGGTRSSLLGRHSGAALCEAGEGRVLPSPESAAQSPTCPGWDRLRGVQRALSASEAPADLRLKMNVPSQCGAEAKEGEGHFFSHKGAVRLWPLRPLDMVDLRTPSSMTLTWNAGDLREGE